MTKQDLEQLRALKAEIKQLQGELQDLPITKDSVKGSMTEHPYIEVSVPIVGADMTKGVSLQHRLEVKLQKLQGQIEEMETWLDGLEDSEMRTILRLYYRNGLTQAQIGESMGYSRESISYKLKTFWRGQER